MSPFTLLIPVLVPVIIAIIKMVLPGVPKWILPVLAPILGAGADIVMYYSGLPSVGPQMAAILGASGVMLREVVDQVKKAMA